jgi:hypothetical protein
MQVDLKKGMWLEKLGLILLPIESNHRARSKTCAFGGACSLASQLWYYGWTGYALSLQEWSQCVKQEMV